MAQLPVWATVRSAALDVLADKPLAARLYAVYLAALVIENVPLLIAPSLPLLSLPGGLIAIGVWAWMMTRWADYVGTRATGIAQPSNLLGPTLVAIIKNAIVLALGFIGSAMVMIFAAILARSAPAVAAGLGVLALAALTATLWVAIRLSLVPARAAIGEGTSLAAGWRVTANSVGALLGINLWLMLFTLGAGIVYYILVSILGAVSIRGGWLPMPDPMTAQGFAQWADSRGARILFIVTEFVASPVMGLVRFIILGATIRAAMMLRSGTAAGIVHENPWVV